MNYLFKTTLILSGLLLIVVAVLLLRSFQYKKQMRLFGERIRERKEQDMNQPVTIEYFDKDVIALANALNEYTDMMKEKTLLLEEERKQLQAVIAGISHDFRTPLTATKGYMQLMEKSGKLDAKNLEYLKIAMSKADYLKSLSDIFFETSLLKADESMPVLEEIHLTNYVTEKLMEQYEWIKMRGINAKFEVTDSDIVVRANEDYLNRIFENLFSNARKYTKHTLEVRLEKIQEGFSFKIYNDTELHSDDFDVNRVFDIFYRDQARYSEGSGLGLYVVKCLVDKLGFRIQASMQENQFQIELMTKHKKNIPMK